jgi:hypothetical protein
LREEGRVQLSITGKGGKVRQVLLPVCWPCAETPALTIRCLPAAKAAGP